MQIIKKIVDYINGLNTRQKIISIRYIISLIIILSEYFIGKELDDKVYFHPAISIVGYVILFIDLFLLPVYFIFIYVMKKRKNIMIRLVEMILSTLSIGFLTIIVIAFFSCFDSSVFNLDYDIEFYNDTVYVERDIWLESRTHIDVYQVENTFFVRYVDHLVQENMH